MRKIKTKRGLGKKLIAIRAGSRTLTCGQVAFLLDCAPRTAAKWIDTGKMRGHRLPDTNDRRVYVDDFVAFCRDNGLRVPAGLMPSVRIALGVAADEAPPGFKRVEPADLQAVLADELAVAAVVGDADGLSEAFRAGRAVREANPAARTALVLDPANAGVVASADFDEVLVRPCDLTELARRLATEATVEVKR